MGRWRDLQDIFAVTSGSPIMSSLSIMFELILKSLNYQNTWKILEQEMCILKSWFIWQPVQIMVLIIDGNSVIIAHVGSNLCYLICSRYLIRSREFIILIFFPTKRPLFFYPCATWFELPSNIVTMVLIEPSCTVI